MAQRDEKGRFVRTKPDYKALYETYNEKYKMECEAYDRLANSYNKQLLENAFLLNHAGPILRWMYNRKFNKGE